MDHSYLSNLAPKKIKKRKSLKKILALLLVISLAIIIYYIATDKHDENEGVGRIISKAVLLICLIISTFFLLLNSLYKFDRNIFKIPKLYCPKCKNHLAENLNWTCPICRDTNDSDKRLFYEECSNCNNNSDVIACPWCKEEVAIGKKANDKAKILHKDLLGGVVDLYKSFEKFKKEKTEPKKKQPTKKRPLTEQEKWDKKVNKIAEEAKWKTLGRKEVKAECVKSLNEKYGIDHVSELSEEKKSEYFEDLKKMEDYIWRKFSQE